MIGEEETVGYDIEILAKIIVAKFFEFIFATYNSSKSNGHK